MAGTRHCSESFRARRRHVFSAKGWFMQARRREENLAPTAPAHVSLGQGPREKSLPKRALKARIKAVFASLMTLLSDCSIAE